MKHRPEILRKPFLFLCSDDSVSVQINRSLPGLPKCYDICVLKVNDYAGWTHREMMLASFVKQAPYAIRTKWMLKLDTDVVAMRGCSGEWCSESLVANDPVFISSPWGYTKPPDAIQKLDSWGDGVPELIGKAPLNLKINPESNCVKTSGRIISWCFFGRVDWLQWAGKVFSGRLPVPSHDTCLWYLAKRHGDMYATVQMKAFGWDHVHGSRLREAVRKAL